MESPESPVMKFEVLTMKSLNEIKFLKKPGESNRV